MVTTAIEETWSFDSQNIFLGEWCKRYERREIYGKLDYQVLPFHWRDREKLSRDFHYLNDLKDRIFSELILRFDEIHLTNFSPRQWRIILEPWLLTYISVLFDRWEIVRMAFEDKDIQYKVVRLNIVKNAPEDFTEFGDEVNTDSWNHVIFNQILDFEYANQVVWENRSFQEKSIKTLRRRGKKTNLLLFVDNLLSFFDRKEKPILFYRAYLSLKQLIIFHLFFFQIPRFYENEFEFTVDVALSSKMRDFALKIPSKNRFEDFLFKQLVENIPKSYLESYSFRYERTKKKYNPKIIFTANAHWSSDNFKIWAALKSKTNQSRYILTSHGGAFPPQLSGFDRFQSEVADSNVTWYKSSEVKDIQLPALKLLGRKAKSLSENFSIIALHNRISYSYRAESAPMSSLSLDTFDLTVGFINALNKDIFESLRIKAYPTSGWGQDNRFDEIYGSNILYGSENKLTDIFDISKLIICTYPQTTFAEAMATRKPTILLYDAKNWEFSDYTCELLNEMMNANIVFHDPIKAAHHINSIKDNIEHWWEDPITKKARDDFSDVALGYRKNENPLLKWVSFFRNEIKVYDKEKNTKLFD
ncbi:LIC12162 family transferase [Leptospira kanakyensis]|uniref:LIC12162 family transferase n=1 Tax=Leptospira kanakyensis TaxID=2484968 RepID=UPI0014384736|nr:LIC12162 family protein [Leptospira kanakyensis]